MILSILHCRKRERERVTMRSQSSHLVLLLLCSTILLSHLAGAQPNPGDGGWKRIKNVKPKNLYHVAGIADFAVSEHNKQTGQDLKFVRVIRGEVDGTYYRLIIQANDHVRKHRYEAVVWEKLWDKLRVLLSFKLQA